MKKYGFRIAVSGLTFATGICVVLLFNLLTGNHRTGCRFESVDKKHEVVKARRSQSDIEIEFKKYVETEFGLTAYFEITNYGNDPYIYRAFPRNTKDETVFTLSDVKLDGIKIDEWKCGTGFSDFELKPGESKIFVFDTGVLNYRWKDEKNFEVGFWLKKKYDEGGQTFWSEKLPITAEITKQILKYRKKQR